MNQKRKSQRWQWVLSITSLVILAALKITAFLYPALHNRMGGAWGLGTLCLAFVIALLSLPPVQKLWENAEWDNQFREETSRMHAVDAQRRRQQEEQRRRDRQRDRQRG